MTKDTIFEIVLNAPKEQVDAVIENITAATKNTDWTVSKGLDGLTIIIGVIAASATKTIANILIKYFERRDNVAVEITVNKSKYKFKGMSQTDIIAILQSIGAKTDDH